MKRRKKINRLKDLVNAANAYSLSEEIRCKHKEGHSITLLAAIHKVSVTLIWKIIHGKEPNRVKSKPVFRKPRRRLNKFEHVEYVRSRWKKIWAMYQKGSSTHKLAKAWKVSQQTILNILNSHNCPLRPSANNNNRMISPEEFQSRIAFCRRPDVIAWQCDNCGEIYNGNIMPFECGCCHASRFTRISIPVPLDISRLDALDNINPVKQSLLVRKRQPVAELPDPNAYEKYQRRLASIIDINLIQARGLCI